MSLGLAKDRPRDTFRFLNLETHKVIMSHNMIWIDMVYGDYKKMLESDVARVAEVNEDDDSDTEVNKINLTDIDNNEIMDDEQDPELSEDKNQFTGVDDDNSDDEMMDKLDTEVLVPPVLKVA